MTNRWPGRPMRETVRTIAAAYAKGDRIRLAGRPDPGTVTEVRCERGTFQYRAAWDGLPDDGQWYAEACIRPLGDDLG